MMRLFGSVVQGKAKKETIFYCGPKAEKDIFYVFSGYLHRIRKGMGLGGQPIFFCCT